MWCLNFGMWDALRICMEPTLEQLIQATIACQTPGIPTTLEWAQISEEEVSRNLTSKCAELGLAFNYGSEEAI